MEGTVNERSDDQQARFLSALLALGRSNRLTWARRPVEPEFINCFIEGELLRFELSQGQAPFDPKQAAEGIRCIARNTSFLWLSGTPGWEELIVLLSGVPTGGDDLPKMMQYAREDVIQKLALLARKSSST